MSDDRLATLESLVTDLRINEAKYTAATDNLTHAVEALTTKVEGLTEAMNQGKGAVWMLAGGSGGLIGAVMAWVASHLFGK